MFHAREDDKPIKVEGTLVVYAFDETNRDPRNVRPERKYVFTEEQLEKHYSKSPLGHSYSVWLPWDRVGGSQKEISLLVRFTPKKGGTIAGEESKLVLPGTVANPSHAPPPAIATQRVPPVQMPLRQASYQAPVAGPPQSIVAPPAQQAKQMTVATIPITSGPGNRLPQSASYTGAAPQSQQAPPDASQTTAPAGVATQQAADPLTTRFGPGRLRPLGAPIARLSRDRGPWRPTLATPPSAPASSPGSVPQPGLPASSAAAY
jgi:hypothetical protein